MKTAIIVDCGKVMTKLGKKLFSVICIIVVVITLKQEVSKNSPFLSLVLSVCFTNLRPKLSSFLGDRGS